MPVLGVSGLVLMFWTSSGLASKVPFSGTLLIGGVKPMRYIVTFPRYGIPHCFGERLFKRLSQDSIFWGGSGQPTVYKLPPFPSYGL